MKLSISLCVCVCVVMKKNNEDYKQEWVSYSVPVCKHEIGLHLVDICNIAISEMRVSLRQHVNLKWILMRNCFWSNIQQCLSSESSVCY